MSLQKAWPLWEGEKGEAQTTRMQAGGSSAEGNVTWNTHFAHSVPWPSMLVPHVSQTRILVTAYKALHACSATSSSSAPARWLYSAGAKLASVLLLLGMFFTRSQARAISSVRPSLTSTNKIVILPLPCVSVTTIFYLFVSPLESGLLLSFLHCILQCPEHLA